MERRMLAGFSTEYSQRSDNQILHPATQRHSLTAGAATAPDAELRRRTLTESDRVEHQIAFWMSPGISSSVQLAFPRSCRRIAAALRTHSFLML